MYVVRRGFKGDGHEYRPGDEFEPAGGRWDAEVIRRFCAVVEVDEPEPEPKPKRNRRKETNDD